MELRLAVEGAPELGDLQARLLGRVTHALGRQATAEERAGAGKRRGAKKQLAAALADLGGFRATLRSRKGRRLPADLRDRLESAASLLADEVKALRRSL